MRIGSMFARVGSVLKWAALLGVVVALGAGSASAQFTSTTAATSRTVTEGDSLEISYEIKANAAADYGGGTITVWAVYDPDPTKSSTDPSSGRPTPPDGNAGGGDISGGSSGPAAMFQHAVTASGGAAKEVDIKHTQSVFILADADAEDEIGTLHLRITAVATTSGTALTYRDDDVGITACAAADCGKGNIALGTLMIDDPHEQEFKWGSRSPAAPNKPTEGQEASITITADPAPVDYIWNMNARTDNPAYGLSGTDTPPSNGIKGVRASAPFVPWNLDPADVDGNREDDEVELSLYFAGTSRMVPGIEPYTFTFTDIHGLPEPDKITWKAYGSKANGTIDTNNEVESITEGGDPVHVRVTVERGADGYPSGENISVAAVPGEGLAMDYRTEDAPLTFTTSDLSGANNSQNKTFKVWALEDNDIAMEDLVLNLVATGATAANGSGDTTAANPVMLTINDETVPLLTAMTGEMVMETVNAARMAAAAGDGNDLWTPGEMFELDSDDLFTSDMTVDVAARSSGAAVGVSTHSGMVMLEAMEVGTATITITGTVASSFTSTQTVDNIATIEFDLEVDELPLAITLSGPDDMNIAEGMSATVTATANRAVNADTRVELNLVGGSGSPADYSVESIMIRSGQTTGTTMLTATEDSMEEAMETLELEGTFGSGMKTNKLTFNIWDAAVPALPIIAQLLLAAFLAVGGYRRYLRRR